MKNQLATDHESAVLDALDFDPELPGCSRPGCSRPRSARIAGDWLCRSHYNSGRLVAFGQCSYVEGERRCRARRYTRTARQWRASDGFCRLHEPQYLRTLSSAGLAERVESFVSQIRDDTFSGCWFWTGERSAENPRGKFYAAGVSWVPSRFAFAALIGGHENGLELAHLCDHGGAAGGRGPCVNPAHLAPMRPSANKRFEPSLRVTNERVAQKVGTAFEEFCRDHDLMIGWAC